MSSIDKTKAMPAAQPRVAAAAEAWLKDSMDKPPGLWVAVWDPATGYYEHAYGQAVAGSTKATVPDHNWIGSITKTMFATAVLQQVDAGTLALTDTVKALDPAFAATYPTLGALTVAQLLGMISGVHDYADAAVAKVAKDHAYSATRDDLIALGLAAGEQQPPGKGEYSTTNYLILGKVMETLTGQTPEDLVNGVLAQAGMTESLLLT